MLLRLTADAPSGGSLRMAAEQRGAPLNIVTLDSPEVLQAYQARLVLVRPDGHVAWRSDTEPEDAGVVMDVIRGACAFAEVQRDLDAVS